MWFIIVGGLWLISQCKVEKGFVFPMNSVLDICNWFTELQKY